MVIPSICRLWSVRIKKHTRILKHIFVQNFSKHGSFIVSLIYLNILPGYFQISGISVYINYLLIHFQTNQFLFFKKWIDSIELRLNSYYILILQRSRNLGKTSQTWQWCAKGRREWSVGDGQRKYKSSFHAPQGFPIYGRAPDDSRRTIPTSRSLIQKVDNALTGSTWLISGIYGSDACACGLVWWWRFALL